MKINKLTLKNFKSVVDESFSFDNGIICFSGDNGEGKSTVIHAILILLFNSYDLSFRDYVNWNATKFEISMTFEHEGEEYYETFEYSEKGGSKRTFTKLSTNETWENSAAIAKLAELIDPEIAKASIVSMENDQNLITTTPAKRRDYLKSVYDLEFKEQLETIAKDLIDIDKETAACENEMSMLQAQEFPMKEPKELYPEEKYNEFKAQVDDLMVKKSELDSKKQKLDRLAEDIESENRTMRRLSMQLADTKDKILNHENTHADLKNELICKQSEDKLPALREDLESNEKIYISKKTESIKAREATETTMHEHEEKLNALHVDVDHDQIIDKRRELSELRVLIRQSESKLKVLKTGKCPTCGHEVSQDEVDSEEKIYKALQSSESAMAESLASYEEKYTRFSLDQTKYKSNIDTFKGVLADIDKKLVDMRHDYETKKLQIENAIERYESDKKVSIEAIESKIGMLETTLVGEKERVEQIESDLETHRKTLSRLNEDLAGAEDPTKALEEIEGKLNDAKRMISWYDDAVAYNKFVEEYNVEQQKKSGERDDKVNEVKEKINSLNSWRNMIEKSKSIVSREFPSFVISYMVKSLENHVNEFLQKVYPKYQIEIIESKNSLAITYGPNHADVRMASGFEKSAFSLAYMYALGKMQKYGLLIVDEGDGAASDNNSLQFYNTVAKSQEFFPQIFCITHKEVAKDLLQNTYHAQVYLAESGHYSKC